MKYLVIGGNASGASFATRMRRVDDHAEIVVINQGPYISYASCALPYYIGDVIQNRDQLIERTPEGLAKKSNIDVRVNQTATSVDPNTKTVEIYDQKLGTTYAEDYDVLVLATGTSGIPLSIYGLDAAPNAFRLSNVVDADKIKDYINTNHVQTATIIGAGMKGIEIAENLVLLGIKVQMVEMHPDVAQPYDPEITQFIRNDLKDHGVELYLNNSVTKFSETGNEITLADDQTINQDLIIIASGEKPNTDLVAATAVELTDSGLIKVDDHLQTSVKDIYATGDIIQTTNLVSGLPIQSALSAAANRQGHLLADMLGGAKTTYAGYLATGISKVFDNAISFAGYTRQMLAHDGITDYQWIYITPFNHPSYYPNVSRINFVLIFDSKTGQILGGEATGKEGADKLIGELAIAIAAKMTIYDLAATTTPYSPPYSTARSPLNISAYVAINAFENGFTTIRPEEIKTKNNFYLDVRELGSKETGTIPATRHIPLSELKFRASEIPTDKNVYLTFHPGTGNYQAARILAENGIKNKVIME